MIRLLQSPAAVLIAAGLAFFSTFFVVLGTVHFAPAAAAHKPLAAEDDPSWKFRNPDIDQWIAQIKNERDSLALREQQLKEWEARLAAEAREIAMVTQAVQQAQTEFNSRVLQFKEQEVVNAKKQIKLLATLSPEASANMFNTMTDDEAVKLLYLMKLEASSAILEALSQKGPIGAKRAASLAQRIKDVMTMPATNNLSANASR